MKGYLEANLEVSVYPLSIGIFVAFKTRDAEQEFRFRRYQPRPVRLAVEVPTNLYHRHKALLDPLLHFFIQHGRWPLPEEEGLFSDTIAAVGSLGQAKSILLQAVDAKPFQEAIRAKREHLLVYLCGEILAGRPKFSELPLMVQADIREHFKTYKNACNALNHLLTSLAHLEVIRNACNKSPLGKRIANNYYVHCDLSETASDANVPWARVWDTPVEGEPVDSGLALGMA